MEVYIENSIRYTFPFMFWWFHCETQGFDSFDFISKETLFTVLFSRMGVGFAMSADGGTIFFLFLLIASCQLFGRESLKIQSQISLKAF